MNPTAPTYAARPPPAQRGPTPAKRRAFRRFLGWTAAIVALLWIVGGVALMARNSFLPDIDTRPPLCYGSEVGDRSTGPSSGGQSPTSGGFAKTLGDPATSGLKRWPAPFDVAPKTFDINGDGTDEIIAMSNDTNVYVFSAVTGKVLALVPTSYPPNWYIERVLNEVEAAVLVPGQPPSLVISDHAACVAVWQYLPTESKPDHFVFQKMWERRMNECFFNPGMDAKPTLADLNGDGSIEILVQTEEQGFYALAADGTTMWKQCWAGGNSAPVADDLDGDGTMEYIVASDSGFLSVLKGATGDPIWTFDTREHGISPGSVSVQPTVAELDGAKPKEILLTARVAPPGPVSSFHDDHMAIFAVHQSPVTYQTELLWMKQPEWANPLSYTQLAVTDIDQDGAPDIFGMDWNTIGHLPGNWERLGVAHLFRLDAQGNDVWVKTLDPWWSNKDIAIGDIDGDGTPDILANAPNDFGTDGLVRINALSGDNESFLKLTGWQVMRGPLLVDLHHDGKMQLLVPVKPVDDSVAHGAFLIFDLGVPYNVAWRGAP